MNLLFLGIVVSASALTVGCDNKLPPPADHDFLTRCNHTFYKSLAEAGPSGVMVDLRQGERQRHFILTAAHVVEEVSKRARVNGAYGIGFRKANDVNLVRRIEGGLDLLRPFKQARFSPEDAGCFETR